MPKNHSFKPGDSVLLANMNRHRNKFTPRWLQKPCIIEKVQGNSIIVKGKNNKSIMRTSSHVKPYRSSVLPPRNVSSSQSSSDSDFPLPKSLPVTDQVRANHNSTDSDKTIPYDEQEEDIDEDHLFIPSNNEGYSHQNRLRKKPIKFKDYETY